ncbi:MAG TPA: contractile injection system tape measure protein [Steroidobacteraceae bacterium]|nr:contractile injection system tape measure protein [Steroidobacteraceae bacterium]
MKPNRHRIQRQIVELTLGDASSAPGAQESLARACREPLMTGMSSVFDAVAPAEVLVRLDRLEIDVGHLSGTDWAEQFQHRVVAELGRQLDDLPREPVGRRTDTTEGAGGGTFEAFLYFLRHGRLPWWSGAPDAGWANLVAEASVGQLRTLRALLRGEVHACARVIHALGDGQLEDLLGRCAALVHCARVLNVLRPDESTATHHHWRRKFWHRVLEHALAPAAALANGPALVRSLMTERCAIVLERGCAGLENRERDPGASPAVIRPVDVGALPEPWREWYEAFASIEDTGGPVTTAGDADASAMPRQEVARQVRPASAPAEEAELIYLPCAGTLLLHPFLETLFRERELLDGRRFASDASRYRAAQLLGYLATSRPDTPEYDLGMPKLLTGIDLGAPIESAWLDEADITACDALLTAVLGHWTALRSSSAAWLRSQFFLRDARLERVDGGQRVTMERRAQDVLLARLPWGFGVISLPWLPEKIFVQWLD